jgi:ribosomal-protein-alanine N-acetyltransferase
VNPENKYLLLRHAFETLGAIRVQLKTDGRNLHSQRAIAKLGAKLEGTMRRHIIMPDGYFRDTVMYSIIDDEWPGVKAGLEERLGYVP